jgi:hypothetical protein
MRDVACVQGEELEASRKLHWKCPGEVIAIDFAIRMRERELEKQEGIERALLSGTYKFPRQQVKVGIVPVSMLFPKYLHREVNTKTKSWLNKQDSKQSFFF